jgi:DNA-binding MarR family transcriptional regulator
MDSIKDAFQKVKKDIDFLKEQIFSLKQIIQETQISISQLKETTNFLSSKFETINKEKLIDSTDNSENSTVGMNYSTENILFKPLNTQIIPTSTGNEGVPTDKQTNRQTDKQTKKTYLGDAFEILNSLDSIKKEIRNKFKRITDQEFLVFSTIYQLTEEQEFVDYKDLSLKLNLTESSIRDYVGRLIKKGIPLEKTKINNKIIQLSISENLKKIAPLPVIFQLREL